MSARKSIHRRLSRFSIQSQVSGVLDPDSNIASDEEGSPLWFKDFENNSVNIRPSARFSLGQNESAVLDSNSEPDSTPLQKSWWKNLDNTPDVRPSRSNVSRERSNVQERSNLESSDASPLEESITKRRVAIRRKKSKSLQRNIFSEILDASKDSIASDKTNQNSHNKDKQTTINTSTDTDISIGKVRKLPFRRKKRTQLVKKSTIVETKFDESVPNVFKDALNASQSANETSREATLPNEPGNSIANKVLSAPGSPTSGESIRLELEHSPSEKKRMASDISEDTSLGDGYLQRSMSPVIMSRPKTRTIFTKTTKRRSPNFDELLNDETEESVADQPSIREELESNRNENREESVVQPPQQSDLPSNISVLTDDTDTEESIERLRVPFRRKKRQIQQEKMFEQLLESPNISAHSEPVSTRKQTRNSLLPLSDVVRRSSKRKSNPAEISSSSDFGVEGNQSTRKLSRLSSNLNISGARRQSVNKTKDRAETSGPLNAELEENRSSEAAAAERSMNENNYRADTSGASSIELQGNQPVRTSPRLSSVSNKSGSDRRSTNKKTNDQRESYGPLITELEEIRSVSMPIRPSSIENTFGTERRSKSKEKDKAETSRSVNVEVEENRRSVSFKKSRDRSQDKSSSNQSQFDKNRSNIQRKNTLPEVYRKSLSTELLEFADEEENEEDLSENVPLSSDIIDETQQIRGHSNNSIPHEVNRKSVSRQLPSSTDEEQDEEETQQIRGHSNNSTLHEVNRKSVSRQSPSSTDEEQDEEEPSENVEDLPCGSDVIYETPQNSTGDSNNSNLVPRVERSGNNIEMEIPVGSSNNNVDQRKTTSSKKSVGQNLEKTVEPLQETNQVIARESNRVKRVRSDAADGIENTEVGESQLTGVEGIAQSVIDGPELSFSSNNNNKTGSNQQTNISLGEGSQATIPEKLSQLKSALEKIKGKEIVLMKNSKIDFYFKKTSSTEPAKDVAEKNPQKLPKKPNPVVNKRKITSVSPNKAYVVNGKVYKRPRLPRPKSWVTDRLYNHLWKKMEEKYQLRTRVRSEKFIVELSQVVAIVVRRKKYDNYKEELNNLIHEMARLRIIRTRNDFNIFCREFLPYEFRIKVIPMLLPGNVRNIPFDPSKLHTPILEL